jgi:hypothetical protein
MTEPMEPKIKKNKMNNESIVRIIREHAEMSRLLEVFPKEIDDLPFWLKKRKVAIDKILRKDQ